MVKEIVLVIDPALHKIEEILLWRSKWKTCLCFVLAHLVFWLYYSVANVRTYCLLFSLLLMLHLIDGYRQKKRRQLAKSRQQLIETETLSLIPHSNMSSLGRYILYIDTKVGQVLTRLSEMKRDNKIKYFVTMLVFWCVLGVLGTRVKGVYLSYMIFWIVFCVPAIIHYDLMWHALRKALPLLEQLDQSMRYERRSILDKSELLVDVRVPSSEHNDDEQEDQYLEEFKLSEEQRRAFEQRIEDNNIEDNEELDSESGSVDEYMIQSHQRLHDDCSEDEEIHGTSTSFSYNYEINDESTTNDSMLPDDSLPNLSDVTIGERRVKKKTTNNRSRPSVLNYYETYLSGSGSGSTNKILPSHNIFRLGSHHSGRFDKDIDDTFDFLDGELK